MQGATFAQRGRPRDLLQCYFLHIVVVDKLYHGLQLQLMIYMDGALTVEQNKHKDKDVIPAGVFYYNIKDPMIQEKIDADIETVQEKVLKELKMNGLVLKDKELVQKMDSSLVSIPVSFNKDEASGKILL